MASPLTPVVITDKNGRITTVHRRNPKLGKAKVMPAPRITVENEARKTMLELGIAGTYSRNAVPNISYLAEHSPKTLQGIIARCANGGKEATIWQIMLQSQVLFSSPDEMVLHNNLESCKALLELYPVAEKIAEAANQSSPAMIEYIIQSTMYYAEKYRQNGWDVFRIAMIANHFMTDDDEKHDVIFTHVGRLSEVIDLIPELTRRGKVDAETMEMLLDSEYPALRDGEL